MINDFFTLLPIWLIAMIAVTVLLAVYFVILWIAGTRYARQRAYFVHPATEKPHKRI